MCNKTIQYPSTRPPPGLTALPPRWRFYPAALLTPALSFVMYKPRILINSPFSLLKYRISIRDTDFFFFFHIGKEKSLIKISTDLILTRPIKVSFFKRVLIFTFTNIERNKRKRRFIFNFNLNLVSKNSGSQFIFF